MGSSTTVVVDSGRATFDVLVVGGVLVVDVVGGVVVVVGGVLVVVVVGSLSVRGFSAAPQETANNKRGRTILIFLISKLATNFYFSK